MHPTCRKIVIGLAALGLAPLGVADAQELDGSADNEGIRIFELDYYTEFDPISALELVFRTPGFNPQEDDGGRGLSGVRSNILINGERPPPKGQSIRQQLREMPVGGIAYIELIDAGARLDIDMQGYPQVVNVITVENAPAYYEVTTQLQRAGTGGIQQENERVAEVQATGSFSWNDHEFTLRGNAQDRSDRNPADFVTIDPANPEQRVTSLNRSESIDQGLELGAIFALPSDSSLTFNGQFYTDEWSSSPEFLIEDDPDAVDETSDSDDDRRDISVEYRRPFGLNNELMVALVDAHNRDHSQSSLSDGGVFRSSVNDRESGETAARVLVTLAPSERITLRTTATTAFNFFEGDFRIFENGVELPVQGSDSRVEEDRHSIDGAVDWNISDKWLFRSTVGVESYEIETRDHSSGVQTDPKGEISISFRPQPRTTFTLATSREIGQLSFNQFLASSSLSSEIITAGATELEPERTSRHSASYDRRFGDVGVMRFSLYRNVVQNPVRQIALSDELIVAQNTSPQRFDRLQASLEFPFEQWGREDLVFSVGGMYSQSETVDPVTGETREVSGAPRRYWEMGFRRDPGDSELAWGFSVGGRTQGGNYSVRRIREPNSRREWQAFVEWEPIDGLKFRTQLEGPRTDIRRSSFFAAVRTPGLDPSFLSSTVTHIDRSASFQVEWRRRDKLEITASLSTRPRIRTDESLTPFGETIGSLLTTTIDRTPRASVRFRVYR